MTSRTDEKLEKVDAIFSRDGNLVTKHWKDKSNVDVMNTIHGNGVEIIQIRD